MIKLKSILNEIFDANLLETNSKYKIFCDLDGVLVDFDKGVKQKTGMSYDNYLKSKQNTKDGENQLWDILKSDGSIWWETLPWTIDGHVLWNYLKNKHITILTSGNANILGDTSEKGKKGWVIKNLNSLLPVIVTPTSNDKQKYAAPYHILVDDKPLNITQWESKGGIGILHKSANDSVNKLKTILEQ